MNKQSKKVLLGAATVAAMLGAQNAHAAKTATISINAKIIDAVSIAQTQTLNFGSLTYTAAGTLSVDTAGATGVTGGVTAVGAAAQQGGFSIKGENGLVADIALTAATVALNHATAADTMQVKSFVFGGASVTAAAYDVNLTGGTQNSNYIGATLTVAGTEAVGAYSGTVKITSAYQ